MTTTGGDRRPWLVVVDMQVIFGEPSSPWFTPGFPQIVPAVQALIASFDERVVYTRFVAPAEPAGVWILYYQQWPFALVPPTNPLYALAPGFSAGSHPVVDRETFGKWGTELDAAVHSSWELVLAGVSTDCCVLSTALAAADAGVHVRVVSDACAGVSEADHRRALDAMALYGPLIEITTVDEIIATALPAVM